jgi:diguanylate cyclase (GGDEF)-like protein
MSSATLPGPGQDNEVLLQALKQRRWWQVALPQDLEPDYARDQLESRMHRGIVSGWLALGVFDSFLLVDWLMANDVFWFSALVRLLLFTPLSVAALWAMQRYMAQIIQRQMIYLTDFIIISSGWLAALCLAVILFKSSSPLAMYYHAGFMVVMVYGTLVQQLQVRPGVLFLAGILGLHLICATYGHPMPLSLHLAMTEILLVTAAFCVVASVGVERARRRRYLLFQRERNLSASLLDVNMKLQNLSRSDVLTGVGNRRHFHEYMQQVWDRSVRDAAPVSVLMLDVDHFKLYNDRYGHPAGDECLRQVAHAVSGCLRTAGDFVARYGGEEFVAVLPNATPDIALRAAERVRQAVQDLGLRHEGSTTAEVVTISVGVATVVAGLTATSPDKLVSCADRALYEAKQGQRNRVAVYVP